MSKIVFCKIIIFIILLTSSIALITRRIMLDGLLPVAVTSLAINMLYVLVIVIKWQPREKK